MMAPMRTMIRRTVLWAGAACLLTFGTAYAGPFHPAYGPADPNSGGPAAPKLRLAGATTVEIALAWDAVPGAVSYILERSASAAFGRPETVELKLPANVTGYGDTGRDPYDGSRFRMGVVGRVAGFRPGARFHYRLKGVFAGGARPDGGGYRPRAG